MNVIRVIQKTALNIDEITKIICEINPHYPYWQALGFMLSYLNKKDEEKQLRINFSKYKKVEFFLDRKYKKSWLYDDNWKIHYPPSIKDV